MWVYNDPNTLMHYGVKGMKWGVRRYQNKDGSLTPAGKKRYSKEYEKLSKKITKNVQRNANSIRIQSYNESADYMNRGGIERFNREQEKKYGSNFASRSEYEQDYEKFFNDVWTKNADKRLYELYTSDKNYKKAQDLVNRYSMTSWDELARNNQSVIEDLRKRVEG